MLQLSVRLPYIALMPWLQEVESARQVQYSSTVGKFQRRKGKIARRGKLRNLFLMSKVCT